MRAEMAAITKLHCASDSSAQDASWLGCTTRTSCAPEESAWVKMGPRCSTTMGSRPSKAGYRFGTTRTAHEPSGPGETSMGGSDSARPGQNGHGRLGSVSTGSVRTLNSLGRCRRSALIATQRPVSGSSRSWLMYFPRVGWWCCGFAKTILSADGIGYFTFCGINLSKRSAGTLSEGPQRLPVWPARHDPRPVRWFGRQA
jgi:hypothetical protein